MALTAEERARRLQERSRKVQGLAGERSFIDQHNRGPMGGDPYRAEEVMSMAGIRAIEQPQVRGQSAADFSSRLPESNPDYLTLGQMQENSRLRRGNTQQSRNPTIAQLERDVLNQTTAGDAADFDKIYPDTSGVAKVPGRSVYDDGGQAGIEGIGRFSGVNPQQPPPIQGETKLTQDDIDFWNFMEETAGNRGAEGAALQELPNFNGAIPERLEQLDRGKSYLEGGGIKGFLNRFGGDVRDFGNNLKEGAQYWWDPDEFRRMSAKERKKLYAKFGLNKPNAVRGGAAQGPEGQPTTFADQLAAYRSREDKSTTDLLGNRIQRENVGGDAVNSPRFEAARQAVGGEATEQAPDPFEVDKAALQKSFSDFMAARPMGGVFKDGVQQQSTRTNRQISGSGQGGQQLWLQDKSPEFRRRFNEVNDRIKKEYQSNAAVGATSTVQEEEKGNTLLQDTLSQSFNAQRTFQEQTYKHQQDILGRSEYRTLKGLQNAYSRAGRNTKAKKKIEADVERMKQESYELAKADAGQLEPSVQSTLINAVGRENERGLIERGLNSRQDKTEAGINRRSDQDADVTGQGNVLDFIGNQLRIEGAENRTRLDINSRQGIARLQLMANRAENASKRDQASIVDMANKAGSDLAIQMRDNGVFSDSEASGYEKWFIKHHTRPREVVAYGVISDSLAGKKTTMADIFTDPDLRKRYNAAVKMFDSTGNAKGLLKFVGTF